MPRVAPVNVPLFRGVWCGVREYLGYLFTLSLVGSLRLMEADHCGFMPLARSMPGLVEERATLLVVADTKDTLVQGDLI
jgi:hypothetical protein